LLELPVERGVWADWVMHIRWSTGSTGRFRAWMSGVLVYDEAGPNMNAGTTAGGHHQKLGMYGSFTGGLVSERILYYDEVRVARGPEGYALVLLETHTRRVFPGPRHLRW
jgi:hypothetical protein